MIENMKGTDITDWNDIKLAKRYIGLSENNELERKVNAKDIMEMLPSYVESVLDFGFGSLSFMEVLNQSGRFKRVAGADLPATLQALKELRPDKLKKYEVYEWDGLKEIPANLKGIDAAILKLVTPFLSDEDLNEILKNISEHVLSGGKTCIVFSLPHPENLRKKHNLDLKNIAIYDEYIPNRDKPSEDPIPIRVVYRPVGVYEKILSSLGYKLSKVSEPVIPADMLKDLPQGYGEYPYRLNLLFEKDV